MISYGSAWAVLRLTNTGVLFHRAEVIESTASQNTDSGNTKKMLHCSYFTGTHVVERKFSHEELPYDDDHTGLLREGSCPWWIDVP